MRMMSKMQRGKGKKDMMVYFSLALIYPHENASQLIHKKTENENDHLTRDCYKESNQKCISKFFLHLLNLTSTDSLCQTI